MKISGRRIGPRSRWGATLAVLVAAAVGCTHRSVTPTSLQAIEGRLAPLESLVPSGGGGPTPDRRSGVLAFEGSLSNYLAYAFEHSPALRASFERWRAATHRPARERRLPEPVITYTGFVRAVQTRVGPQRHRLGAKQWFPWPTQLGAAARAAGLEAQAEQREFEAHALALAAEVSAAYWAVWRVQRTREVRVEEAAVLTSLSEQVRVRLEVGAAELSDVAQLDLWVTRTRDQVVGLRERERVASAELVRAIGAPEGTPIRVSSPGPLVVDVDESIEALTRTAHRHPRVDAIATRSRSAGERVHQARADRYPSFGVGIDWIVTGRSDSATPPSGDGRDAVSVGLSVEVPLWTRSYRAAEDEAKARQAMWRARAIDARDRVVATVRQRAAQVSDDVRRARVHRTTLIPQARTAFEAVLSQYVAGRSNVAELLLAERELVGLRDGLVAAQADYGWHLAALERAVGRAVRTRGSTDDR